MASSINQEIKYRTEGFHVSDLPPVFFNHLYVVLDDKTYRAIQASDFLLTAFPGVERRATRTAAGETWSGTYYYGRDNYLELFGQSTSQHWFPNASSGWAGLAFSTDAPGGVEAVKERVQSMLGYEPFHELRRLIAPDKTVNWFYHVKLAERLGLESFDSWVMEYHPEIFAHKAISLPPSANPTREAYLSGWNRPDNRKSSPVFNRVIGATMNLDERRAGKFGQILQALGYEQKVETGQVVLSANGFSLTIRITPGEAAPPGYRISCIKLEMARPSVAPMTFVFAPGSRLVLKEDMTAEWCFGG